MQLGGILKIVTVANYLMTAEETRLLQISYLCMREELCQHRFHVPCEFNFLFIFLQNGLILLIIIFWLSKLHFQVPERRYCFETCALSLKSDDKKTRCL